MIILETEFLAFQTLDFKVQASFELFKVQTISLMVSHQIGKHQRLHRLKVEERERVCIWQSGRSTNGNRASRSRKKWPVGAQRKDAKVFEALCSTGVSFTASLTVLLSSSDAARKLKTVKWCRIVRLAFDGAVRSITLIGRSSVAALWSTNCGLL